MKKEYWAILLIGLLWSSCNHKNQPKIDEKQGFQIDTVTSDNVQRMQVSESHTDVKFKGKEYHISIRRVPCDSLKRVKDQTGASFVDNEIILFITRDNGERFFSKTFTKKSFASVIDDRFLAQSILEGMVYDRISEDGIILAASVCYPQTDLYVPLKITIAPDGSISMVKEEVLDENYVDEDSLR